VGASPEQRAEWLPKLASAELIGAFALTEPLSGSDSARGLRTTARREGDRWILNGEKRWIGNATFADVVVVFAKDLADGQVKGFLVTTDTPGFRATKIEDKISLRSVQNADIVLTDVVVPESHRLPGIRSFRDVATVLRLTRCDVAWAAIGIAVGAYDAALTYAREREQFGKPIAAHQLVQDLLARCLGNITASIALCMQASALQDEGIQRDEHSALAKSFATSKMRETVGWAREILGGNGIVLDYGVAKFFADAEAIYSYEGTRDMNSLIVGRAITGHAAFV
jgi:glutaryl-CoA dehydrogenase